MDTENLIFTRLFRYIVRYFRGGNGGKAHNGSSMHPVTSELIALAAGEASTVLFSVPSSLCGQNSHVAV